MRLKAQNNCITISYQCGECRMNTCFIIKAANVNEEQALKISNILFPDFNDIKVESIKNDELTLTYEDYKTLHMMVNDKLVWSMRESKTPYDKLTHPIDLKYKKLLEKMESRIGQFLRASF
jgi:hypothetical protein